MLFLASTISAATTLGTNGQLEQHADARAADDIVRKATVTNSKHVTYNTELEDEI